MDKDLIKGHNLIKEREFDERTGAPALRLIGDVTTTVPTLVKKAESAKPVG